MKRSLRVGGGVPAFGLQVAVQPDQVVDRQVRDDGIPRNRPLGLHQPPGDRAPHRRHGDGFAGRFARPGTVRLSRAFVPDRPVPDRPVASAAASTSRSDIRPPRPVPTTVERSTPSSSALRRANGLALISRPPPSGPAAAAGAAAAADLARARGRIRRGPALRSGQGHGPEAGNEGIDLGRRDGPVGDHGDQGADGMCPAGRHGMPQQPVGFRFERVDDLVRFDIDKIVAPGDGGALLDMPGGDRALRHFQAPFGQGHGIDAVLRHQRPASSARISVSIRLGPGT